MSHLKELIKRYCAGGNVEKLKLCIDMIRNFVSYQDDDAVEIERVSMCIEYIAIMYPGNGGYILNTWENRDRLRNAQAEGTQSPDIDYLTETLRILSDIRSNPNRDECTVPELHIPEFCKEWHLSADYV